MSAARDIGIVLIGRNEGARLLAALAALKEFDGPLVYVDSGSSDSSIDAARASRAQVVALDRTRPFTAARARNAGFAALGENPPALVQFIDGDCVLCPGWLEAGSAALRDDPELGLVTGWRREMVAGASVYNALCDWEWRRPAGPIIACGGDMMVRSSAFSAVGGFDETVIAAEDDEFCLRLAGAGWQLRRLPVEMTRHDAAMTRFSQWWRRAERSGHGFAQVADLHPGYFAAERRRVWIFGLLLPLAALVALALWPWALVAIAAAYGLSYWRGVQSLRRDGVAPAAAWRLGGLLTLSKLPNAIGMIRYALRRGTGRKMTLIEYK